MTRGWRIVLVASLLVNLLGVALVLAKWGPRGVAERAGIVEPKAPERLDYDARAAERFADLDGAPTVLVGDSLVEWGEWAEISAEPVANRGLAGATVAEVTSWVPDVLTGDEDRVIVWAGTNDVLLGQAEGVGARYADLLDEVQASAPDAEVTALTVPPMDWVAEDVDQVNAAIRDAAAEVRVVDVAPAVKGQRWADGVHLRPGAYEALVSLLRIP